MSQIRPCKTMSHRDRTTWNCYGS